MEQVLWRLGPFLVQLILARFFLPAADEVDPRGFTLGGSVSASLMLIVFCVPVRKDIFHRRKVFDFQILVKKWRC